MMSDQELRDGLRRLAPDVQQAGVWEAMHQRDQERAPIHRPLLASGKQASTRSPASMRPRRISRTRRIIGLSATAVVLAVAAYGINLLVTYFGQNDNILVITDAGIAGQGSTDPSVVSGAGTLTGAKAELWTEIQRIREGVASGELTFEWTSSEATQNGLLTDSMLMLDQLERSLLGPDIAAYLGDTAGEATALRAEISDMANVARLEFVSKDDALRRLKETFSENPEILSGLTSKPIPASLEIWLSDYSHVEEFADEMRGRLEVDKVMVYTKDDAYWVERLQYLRSLTHPSGSTASPADATTSPAGTGADTTTTSFVAPTGATEEVQGYLDKLESIWKAAGIPVLAVTTAFPDVDTAMIIGENTEEGDPLPWVVVELPSSVFASMDYLFVTDNIDRQTMVAASDGVPLKYLGILEVWEDGSKTLWTAGQVATSDPEWGQPARLGLDETTDRLRGAGRQAATTAGVTLESLEVTEDASGRVVLAVGSIPNREEVSATVAGFGGPLEEAVRALNKEGAKISGLNVKVDDLSGAPVLRFALSLNYGNDGARSARWLAPQLKAVMSE